MSDQPDIASAREDVQRTRAQISDTIAALEERVTAPVRAVQRRLDVGQVVRDHPWAALATAVGVGAAVAVSGADRRAASAAADVARQGVEKAKVGGVAGVRLAREAPSRARSALGSVVDALGAKVALSLIGALREGGSASGTGETRAGLGYVRHDASAQQPEELSAREARD